MSKSRGESRRAALAVCSVFPATSPIVRQSCGGRSTRRAGAHSPPPHRAHLSRGVAGMATDRRDDPSPRSVRLDPSAEVRYHFHEGGAVRRRRSGGPSPAGGTGWIMASTLREELASLRIERTEPSFSSRPRAPKPGGFRRGGGALRLLSWLLWLIPLGLLGVGGSFAYKQYDQIRSRPAVMRGLVQRMTSGEAAEAPERHRLPQVAVAGDDRDQNTRPRRANVCPRGNEGQEGRDPRRHRAQRHEGAPGLARGPTAQEPGRARRGPGRPVAERARGTAGDPAPRYAEGHPGRV